MQIREATELDIPAILEVLKATLGETSSKKTAEIWRYKHIDNPFGESLVLVAEEDNKIIGVRAFMRWKWQKADKAFMAYRAVDTATHPEHQGKGIFKKLTLKALKLGEKRNDHFVFNTPNEQSKPGYLKMGWKEVGKIKVSLKPFFYFNFKKIEYKHSIKEGGLDEAVFKNLYTKQQDEGKIFTPKTADYLDWRFKNCKLQEYMIYEDSGVFVAAYLKKRGRINELRVSEVIALTAINKKKANKKIKSFARRVGAQIITAAPGVLARSITGEFGPVLTHKNLSLNLPKQNCFEDINSWAYTLGDLELF